MTPDVRHQHLIVRAEIAKPPMSEDCDRVVTWLRDLISKIEMKIMYGPIAEYCHVEGNRGMTAFAIIETSHLAFHSWDEMDTAILQLDVYTCSDLVIEDVFAELTMFEPTRVDYKFLDREHGLTLVTEQVG
jgi:S-adenosylmethionine/arginine decarboxylase-like enzyme